MQFQDMLVPLMRGWFLKDPSRAFFNGTAVSLRPLSLYCLVNEVLRHGKIGPDEEKK